MKREPEQSEEQPSGKGNAFFTDSVARATEKSLKSLNPFDSESRLNTGENLALGSFKGVAGAGAGLAALLNIKAVRKYFGLSNRKEVEQQIKDALKKAAKSKKSSTKQRRRSSSTKKSSGGKRRTYRRRRR